MTTTTFTTERAASPTWATLVEQDSDGLAIERISSNQQRKEAPLVTFLTSKALRTRFIYRESLESLVALAYRNGVRVGITLSSNDEEEGLTNSAILLQTKDSERLVRALRLVLGHLMSPIPQRPPSTHFLLTESRNGFRTEFFVEGEKIFVQRSWNPSLADDFVKKMKAKGQFQEVDSTENTWLYVSCLFIRTILYS